MQYSTFNILFSMIFSSSNRLVKLGNINSIRDILTVSNHSARNHDGYGEELVVPVVKDNVCKQLITAKHVKAS